MIGPVLADERVRLRAWHPSEAGLYVALRDAQVFRFTTEDADLDPRTCRIGMARTASDPNRVAWAICLLDGQPVGDISAVRDRTRATLSYWLAPAGRGLGLATAALRLATEWVLDEWGVVQAELEIDLANQASVRVAEAAGYRRVGRRLVSACGGPAFVYRRHRIDQPRRG